jgi:REP element-mobilizing transposase RayT
VIDERPPSAQKWSASVYERSGEVKLKGISARKIFQIHPEYREEMFRKGSFWSPGHFSRSVSNVTAATVERYIDRHECPKHISDGTGHQGRMGRFM